MAPAAADRTHNVRLARGPADLRSLLSRAIDFFGAGVASTSARPVSAAHRSAPAPPPRQLRGQLEANLRFAKSVLERRRLVLERIVARRHLLRARAGVPPPRAGRATAEVHRLVGCMKPDARGDDFIVGWLAPAHHWRTLRSNPIPAFAVRGDHRAHAPPSPRGGPSMPT